MKIDKAMLGVVAAASDEVSRQNLNCIRIESDRTVATDGHILAQVDNVETVEGFACQLSPVDVASILKAIPKGKRHDPEPDLELSTINGSSLSLSITSPDGQQTIEKEQHQGDFPDYKAFIPNKPVTFRVGFNLALLEQLGRVIKAAGGSKDKDTTAIILDFYDEPSKTMKRHNGGPAQGGFEPIRVTCPDAPRFTGLLMPMRYDARK